MDIKPRYEQNRFESEKRKNKFQIIVSPEGEKESISINQDVYFSLVDLDKDHSIRYPLHNPDNGVYVFLIAGSVKLGENHLEERDGAEISDTSSLEFRGHTDAQILCIETPL